MTKKHVLLGVTGCIAAYKACEVLRGLQKAGCEVRVTMTKEAEQFVGTATFEALSGYPVLTDLFSFEPTPIGHIDLTAWADLVLVAPATANVMAQAAQGSAPCALTSCLLAADSPVLLAPAMNTRMWRNPATQHNIETLHKRGVTILTPDAGRLACGDVGEGKLPTPEAIVAAALELLRPNRSLEGKRVLVTAGPTHEAIDPVRYIANSSSGKMGYAIAQAAHENGAEVVLVSGPTALNAPEGVKLVNVVSADDMHREALAAFEGADAAICAAAVADYTPAHPSDHKLKKGKEELDRIELVRTKDILASLSAAKGERVIVGFAAETNNLLANAQAKLERKGCDLIVANDVSRQDSTFGSDTNKITFVDAQGVHPQPLLPKSEVAKLVVTEVAKLLSRMTPQ